MSTGAPRKQQQQPAEPRATGSAVATSASSPSRKVVVGKITYFESQAAFRKWLERHHAESSELWVGFYRKDTGKGGITYPQALDEALCFGWIDGVKKKVDDVSFTQRFTPRRARSIWSLVNTRRAEQLKALGLMHPSGLKVFEARDPARSGLYSFEKRPSEFDDASRGLFEANVASWAFFKSQPPGYQRVAIHWVMEAKQETTRRRRLARLIDDSANRRRLGIVGG